MSTIRHYLLRAVAALVEWLYQTCLALQLPLMRASARWTIRSRRA